MEKLSSWQRTIVTGGTRRALNPGEHTVRTRPRDHRLSIIGLQFHVPKDTVVKRVLIAGENVLGRRRRVSVDDLQRAGKGTILEPGEEVEVTVETKTPGSVVVCVPGLKPPEADDQGLVAP